MAPPTRERHRGAAAARSETPDLEFPHSACGIWSVIATTTTPSRKIRRSQASPLSANTNHQPLVQEEDRTRAATLRDEPNLVVVKPKGIDYHPTSTNNDDQDGADPCRQLYCSIVGHPTPPLPCGQLQPRSPVTLLDASSTQQGAMNPAPSAHGRAGWPCLSERTGVFPAPPPTSRQQPSTMPRCRLLLHPLHRPEYADLASPLRTAPTSWSPPTQATDSPNDIRWQGQHRHGRGRRLQW
jgi:hypothetical protein